MSDEFVPVTELNDYAMLYRFDDGSIEYGLHTAAADTETIPGSYLSHIQMSVGVGIKLPPWLGESSRNAAYCGVINGNGDEEAWARLNELREAWLRTRAAQIGVDLTPVPFPPEHEALVAERREAERLIDADLTDLTWNIGWDPDELPPL